MKNLYPLSIVLGVLILLVFPNASYADWGGRAHAGFHGGHHYYRYHDHPHFGVHVAAFYPDEYYPIWAGGTRYYYDDGIYYNNIGGNYVVASAPVGAVVSAIPSDFQPVVINGTTYYSDHGTYYVHTSSGYQVIAPPQGASSVGSTVNALTVNVPRVKGGYVSITLKKSGNGYLGPQGEFYTTFPTISQLQMMYGK